MSESDFNKITVDGIEYIVIQVLAGGLALACVASDPFLKVSEAKIVRLE